MSDLEKIINDAFEDRDNINVKTAGDIRNAVDETLNKLDNGSLRAVSYTHLTLPTSIQV